MGPNIVRIVLKTDLKDVKESVAKANEDKGFVEVNVNTSITWMQLFLNLDIPQTGDFVVKNDLGDIASQLTDTIKSYIEKFSRTLKCYSAKIMKKSLLKKPIPNLKVLSPKTKNTPPTSPKGALNIASPPKARARGRPPGSKNSPTRKATPKPKPKAQVENIINNVFPNGGGNVMDIDDDEEMEIEGVNGNIVNGRTSNDIVNGGGNSNAEHGSNNGNHHDRDETDSLFSCATYDGPSSSSGQFGRPNSSSEVKAIVIESLVKNVSNSMLWRIKDEYDELQRKGKWLRLCSTYIPQLGSLVNDMFTDKHFQKK